MAVCSLELKAFLVETPFFGGLSESSLDLLISMLVERHFEAGSTVVAEGEPGRSMFIVRSGELSVRKLGNMGCVIDIDSSSRRWRFLRRNDAHRNAQPISHNRGGETGRVVRANGPKPVYIHKTDIHAYVM